MPGGALFHPRVSAKVIVPAIGLPQERVAQQATTETFTLNVRPTKVRLVSNNYNEADECEITGTYDEMGLDPRYMRSAELYVYLGDADVSGVWTPGSDDLRFVGIARDVKRGFDEHGGKTVTIMAQDYTCLFLEAKSFSAAKIPTFSMTLREAWQTICENTGYWDLDTKEVTSTVSVFKDRLYIFQGAPDDGQPGSASAFAPGPTLGSAVPPRLAKFGKLQLHGTTPDAWAIWRTCCESLGLMTFIRNDRCIVCQASDFYTGGTGNSPRLVYGLNVLKLEEARDLGQLSSKWVCVRAYDPLANTSLESFYPDPSIAPRRKRLAASATQNAQAIKAQDYECFELPFAVAEQSLLDTIAERIWQERTRQELHGHLTTREMTVPTASQSGALTSPFDLLKLAAGDQIQVEIDPASLDGVQSLSSMSAKIAVLQAKGYSSDMANFIAKNLSSIGKLPAQFLVHQVETEMEISDSGSGSYSTRIEFLNRVDVSETGAVSADAEGTPQPPIANQRVGII